MIRTLRICALIVIAAVNASCLFEDIGSDPHPPTVLITGLVRHDPDAVATDPAMDRFVSSGQGRTITWDSGGFAVTPGEMFQIARVYTDAGGDIVKFVVRDRDGELKTELTPTDQTYYSGTSGTVVGPTGGLEVTGVAGPHRLELWAEDSHLSRSEKVEFVVTLVY